MSLKGVDFFRPPIGEDEIRMVTRVLRSKFIGYGPMSKKFEDLLSDFLSYNGKRPFSSVVSSWTAGAYLVLKSWGIGQWDEVIVPAMTFVATANVVLHVGANPVFVDVDPETALLDLDKVKKSITKRTKVIIPVHLYGQMVDMVEVMRIADKFGIKVLEDSAHCIEGQRDGYKPASLSDSAVFSFYATKNITSGEGGAVVTFDKELHKKVSVMRLHGMDIDASKRYRKYKSWDMIELGYKAAMTDIQAAIIIPQMKKIELLWMKRKRAFERYIRGIERFKLPVKYPKIADGVKHAYHLFTIWVDPNIRDDLIRFLQKNNVGVGIHYRPVHLTKFYREKFGYKAGDFPVAERIGDSTVSLPLFPDIKDEEIEHVLHLLYEFFSKV